MQKNIILDELKLEMSNAIIQKDFKLMSEIYDEIKWLNYQYKKRNRVFFSEIDRNHFIQLPYKLMWKKETSALVYINSKCLEIYCKKIHLKNWQKKFIANDINAYYTDILLKNYNKIYLKENILSDLKWDTGNIVKIEALDSIIITKFEVNEYFL